jgi:hypothetical protein
MRAAVVSLCFCAIAALAQFPFPGQSPYPGGGGPNGGPVPNGGPNGGQVPNGGPNGQAGGGGRRNKQQAPDKGRSDSKNEVTASLDGIMRRVSSSQLVIETGDHRIVWFRISGRTTATQDGKDSDAKDFKVGDHLSVDYTEDDNGIYFGSAITWNQAGTPAERAEAARTFDLPKQDLSAADQSRKSSSPSAPRGDDDRPILRRGNKSGDAAPAQDNPATAQSKPDPKPDPKTASAQPAPAAPPATAQAEPADDRPTTTIRPPDPPNDADDPGRPKLKRGAPIVVNPPKPAVVAEASPGPAQAPNPASNAKPDAAPQAAPRAAAASQPVAIQEDPAIVKARDVAFQFSDKLPNFFCQQITTRYRTEDAKKGWDPIDIVTSDLAYEDGKESYKNIKVGNKAVNKSMDEIGGATSTGEFSSQLLALMEPGSGATFRRDGTDTISGHTASVYKFDVPRERSTWRVEGPSQLYYPAYRGSIWIDKETSRVLRIEQEGRNIPRDFVFDTVETSVDYEFVRLGTPEQFLMPTAAEVLSCERGTSFCSRNRIEFRNYKKFDAESSIKFGTVDQ